MSGALEYQAHIEKGKVVFDQDVQLADGQRVRVVLDNSTRQADSREERRLKDVQRALEELDNISPEAAAFLERMREEAKDNTWIARLRRSGNLAIDPKRDLIGGYHEHAGDVTE